MGCPGALDIPSLLTLFLCFVSFVFATVRPVLGWILRVSGETQEKVRVSAEHFAFCRRLRALVQLNLGGVGNPAASSPFLPLGGIV